VGKPENGVISPQLLAKAKQNNIISYTALGNLLTLSLTKLSTFSRISSSVLGSSTVPICLNKADRDAA